MTEMVLTVKADLADEEAKKFNKLKEKIGTTQNSETLRAIINNCYKNIYGDEKP